MGGSKIKKMDPIAIASLSIAEWEKPIDELKYKIDGATKTTNEVAKDLRRYETKVRKLFLSLAMVLDPTIVDAIENTEETYEHCKDDLSKILEEAERDLGTSPSEARGVDEEMIREEMAIFDSMIETEVQKNDSTKVSCLENMNIE